MANRNIITVSAKANLKNEGFLSKLSSTLKTRRIPPPEQLETKSSLTWHKTTEVTERIKTATGTIAVYSDMTEEEVEKIRESVAMFPSLEEAQSYEAMEPDIASTVIAEAASIAVQSITDAASAKPSTLYIALEDYTPDADDELPLVSGQKVQLVDSSCNKRPRLEPADGVQLLDNSAAKHKIAIRPKRNHPSQRAKVAQETREERWLVRDFETDKEGMVPSRLLGAAPPIAAFASSIKRSLQDMSAEESKEIKRKLTKEMKEIKSSKIRKSSSRILGPSPEDEARAKRAATIRELIETEEEFVKDLEFVMANYFALLDVPSTPKKIKDNKEVIFANFDKIAEFHQSVLIEGVKYHAEVPNLIGKTFLRLERDFDMHSEYCSNEPLADQFLENNLEIRDFFDEYSEKICDDKRLQEHLKLPIQRLNDYQLLLKEIIKFSNRLGDETADLERAYDLMQTIPQRATDAKFLASIEGYKGNLFKLGRLIRHDWFSVSEVGHKTRDRYLFLFKARVLITKVKRISEGRSIFVLRDIIRLPETSLCGLERPRILEFHHIEPQNHPNFPIILESRNQETRDAWLDVVREHVIDTASVDDLLFDDEIRVISEEGEEQGRISPAAGVEDILDLPDDYAEGDQVVPDQKESEGKVSELETLGPPEFTGEVLKPTERLIQVEQPRERFIPIELDSSFKRALEKEESFGGAESSPPLKKRVISPEPERQKEISIPIALAPSLTPQVDQSSQPFEQSKEREPEIEAVKPLKEFEPEGFLESEVATKSVREQEPESATVQEAEILKETHRKEPEPIEIVGESEPSEEYKKSSETTPKRSKEEEEFDFWGARESSPPLKKRASSPAKEKSEHTETQKDIKLEQVEITALKAEEKVAEQSDYLNRQVKEDTKEQEQHKPGKVNFQEGAREDRFRSSRYKTPAHQVSGWRKPYQRRALLEEERVADRKSHDEYKQTKKFEEEVEEIIYLNPEELDDFLERNCLILIEESDSEEDSAAVNKLPEIKSSQQESDDDDDSTSKSYISDEEVKKLPPRISYKQQILLEKNKIKIKFKGLDDDQDTDDDQEENKDDDSFEDIWKDRESPTSRKKIKEETEIEDIWAGRESPLGRRQTHEETEVEDIWAGRESPIGRKQILEETEFEDIWAGRESPIGIRQTLEETDFEDIWACRESPIGERQIFEETDVKDIWAERKSPIGKSQASEELEVEDIWAGRESPIERRQTFVETDVENIWAGRESPIGRRQILEETDVEDIWAGRESPIGGRQTVVEANVEDIEDKWTGRESLVVTKQILEETEIEDIWAGRESPIRRKQILKETEVEDIWAGRESPIGRKHILEETDVEDIWAGRKSPIGKRQIFEEPEVEDIWAGRESPIGRRHTLDETKVDDFYAGRKSPIGKSKTSEEWELEDIWAGRQSPIRKRQTFVETNVENLWNEIEYPEKNNQALDKTEIESAGAGKESHIRKRRKQISEITEGKDTCTEGEFPIGKMQTSEEIKVEDLRTSRESHIRRRHTFGEDKIEDIRTGRESHSPEGKGPTSDTKFENSWLDMVRRRRRRRRQTTEETEVEDFWTGKESRIRRRRTFEETEVKDIWAGRKSPLEKKCISEEAVEDTCENRELAVESSRRRRRRETSEETEAEDVWTGRESPIKRRQILEQNEVKDVFADRESPIGKKKISEESEFEDIWEGRKSPVGRRQTLEKIDEDIFAGRESPLGKKQTSEEPEFEDIWAGRESPIKRSQTIEETEVEDIWAGRESPTGKKKLSEENKFEDIWAGKKSPVGNLEQTLEETEVEDIWAGRESPIAGRQYFEETEVENIWAGRESPTARKQYFEEREVKDILRECEFSILSKTGKYNEADNTLKDFDKDQNLQVNVSITLEGVEVKNIHEKSESFTSAEDSEERSELSSESSLDLSGYRYTIGEAGVDEMLDTVSSTSCDAIENNKNVEHEMEGSDAKENENERNQSSLENIKRESTKRKHVRKINASDSRNEQKLKEITYEEQKHNTAVRHCKLRGSSIVCEVTNEKQDVEGLLYVEKGCETPSRSLQYVTCKSNISEEGNLESDSTSDSNHKIEESDHEESDQMSDDENSSEEREANENNENSCNEIEMQMQAKAEKGVKDDFVLNLDLSSNINDKLNNISNEIEKGDRIIFTTNVEIASMMENDLSDLSSNIISESYSAVFKDEITEDSIGAGNSLKDDEVLEKYDCLAYKYGFNINILKENSTPNKDPLGRKQNNFQEKLGKSTILEIFPSLLRLTNSLIWHYNLF